MFQWSISVSLTFSSLSPSSSFFFFFFFHIHFFPPYFCSSSLLFSFIGNHTNVCTVYSFNSFDKNFKILFLFTLSFPHFIFFHLFLSPHFFLILLSSNFYPSFSSANSLNTHQLNCILLRILIVLSSPSSSSFLVILSPLSLIVSFFSLSSFCVRMFHATFHSSDERREEKRMRGK